MMVMLGLGFGLGLGLMIALKVKWAKNNNTNQPKVFSLPLLMRRARLDNTHARSCCHAQTLHRFVFFSESISIPFKYSALAMELEEKASAGWMSCSPCTYMLANTNQRRIYYRQLPALLPATASNCLCRVLLSAGYIAKVSRF